MCLFALILAAAFEQVHYARWVEVVPAVALACFIAAFAIILIRALRMPRKEVERRARLPLADKPESEKELE